MTLDSRLAARWQYLSQLVEREILRLEATDHRLFDQPFTLERARQLAEDEDLAERVDALALEAAHGFVPVLIATARRLLMNAT